MGKLISLARLSRHYISFLSRDLAKAYFGFPVKTENENSVHVEAAIQWLSRAQDAVPDDDGVSRSYSFIYNPYFQRKGWIASYPETTGYIIPTIFDYAQLSGNRTMYDRALRMADWECDIQLENGAVQGGTVDQDPTPAVFNTGQVIFGWLRAFQETKKEKYLVAARRAGEFLVNIQGEDGAWRQNLSDYAGGSNMEFYSYNTRTAWALLALSKQNDPTGLFKKAGIRNIDFSLQQQTANGWFQSNCLSDPSQPLLHTIAYCIRGILESGIILDNEEYIAQARVAADALAAAQKSDGSLAGRYNAKWEPTVDWSCLTGDAQTAIIWGKLYRISGDKKYLDGMRKINSFLKKVQLLDFSNPDINGGICGSYPVHGNYGKFEILNWAVKFFIDALLLEDAIKNGIKASSYSEPQS